MGRCVITVNLSGNHTKVVTVGGHKLSDDLLSWLANEFSMDELCSDRILWYFNQTANTIRIELPDEYQDVAIRLKLTFGGSYAD